MKTTLYDDILSREENGSRSIYLYPENDHQPSLAAYAQSAQKIQNYIPSLVVEQVSYKRHTIDMIRHISLEEISTTFPESHIWVQDEYLKILI